MVKRTARATLKKVRAVLVLRRNGYSGPFFVGAGLFFMGLWLALPWTTFGTSPVYDLMDQMAIEEFWGAIMMGTAVVMIASAVRRKPREVALGSLVAAFVWFLISASFAAGNITSVTVPLTAVMALRCLSIYKEFVEEFDAVTGVRIFHPPEEDE